MEEKNEKKWENVMYLTGDKTLYFNDKKYTWDNEGNILQVSPTAKGDPVVGKISTYDDNKVSANGNKYYTVKLKEFKKGSSQEFVGNLFFEEGKKRKLIVKSVNDIGFHKVYPVNEENFDPSKHTGVAVVDLYAMNQLEPMKAKEELKQKKQKAPTM
jgi:hypothetical protein